MNLRSFLIALLLLFATFPALAQDRITDEDEARKIFEQVEERQNSISTETAVMEMTITDSRGRTRNRTMKMWSYTEGDNSSSLIVFTEPGNVSGTAFLTIRENGDSSQKLYLPSVGRVQTITSGERGDRFMGSDFTYEDLGDQQSEDYEFVWLEEQDSVYRVRANKPESDQYDYVEFFIDRERFTLNEIHYFNSSDEMIKRLEAESFEQVSDSLWSPSKMTMYDLRDDRNTQITWSDREINVSIPDWRFSERGLRRGI
ncbi:outer membrane lipoprotein-sorting protein [Rhodohalobacter sp. 8-1]|uniref:outer membrane lipoprotein-sorting protein n=1 Tax=Rhodohalobacter sp. 8-1 TaxID=3131972 RepID=UPI0030EBB0CE